MAKNSKIKYVFNVFYGFSKILKYTYNFDNNFQNIAISSFFIAQRAVKSWVIANIHEIPLSHDYFFHFERKVPKFKLVKGYFGGKWTLLQIQRMK